MIMPLHSVRWDVVVIRVGIVGAAGYAGGELMRLLMGHEGLFSLNSFPGLTQGSQSRRCIPVFIAMTYLISRRLLSANWQIYVMLSF